MQSPSHALTIELLAWVAARPRTYGEAMDAWRSNCPRHSVWEDALVDSLIRIDGGGTMARSAVSLTPQGRARLEAARGEARPGDPSEAALVEPVENEPRHPLGPEVEHHEVPEPLDGAVGRAVVERRP
jgi:hypothetical protein